MILVITININFKSVIKNIFLLYFILNTKMIDLFQAEVIDLDDEDEIDDVEKDDKNKPSEVIDLDTTPTKSGVKRSNDDKAAAESSSKKAKVVTEEKDPLAIDSPEPEADEGEEEKEDDKEASADDE